MRRSCPCSSRSPYRCGCSAAGSARAAERRRVTRSEAARSLAPVLLGLLAIAALTSVDVVAAKLALTGHDAGIYGSASLVGRVILYLPAAIITVLLPRVAARAADQIETTDILRRSLVVTLRFCTISTFVYAAAGSTIVRVAFGSDYADAAGLLWLFGVAMTGYALLNVLLVYHLGHERIGFAWLLVSGRWPRSRSSSRSTRLRDNWCGRHRCRRRLARRA